MTTALLHITLITETFPPEINGVANTLGRLCEGLRARGHQVELVRPRQGADQSRPSDDQLLLCRGWPLPGYPGLQWGQSSMHKLLRRWTRQRPDVLYIATEGPLGLSALRAARRLGISVVSGFHTNFQQYSNQYGLSLLSRMVTQYLRWFHNRSTLTLVPSASQRLELERRHFERLGMLSRGVDSQLFHPIKRDNALREGWGLANDDIAVLHVGRLAQEKNLGLLKRCFDALRATYPQRRMRLIIVGDGPQRLLLERELPDAVFCGTQRGEELARHYASGDLFLFPSLTETFGNVVLEAMASGLGVVAYDQAAATQHIRHGYNGVLAMPGDEDAFCDAAIWLLEERETLRRARLNARQHASRQGWPAIIEQFEQQLRGACGEQPALAGASRLI
ncbi:MULTISPECIES: glycosyltransferase family 4 protein [Pseudomonas]|jgi:glycosyltransferase involved in cell wall biosynthesis|uniref:Glycosyltransferase family 1 protein n=2 Tax=Pseudomonas TaxID=286 RepID=A0A4Y9T8M5_PSEFL|nr:MULTISPECIES: glycosyltransferase family 1 protein [Pseudomonas]CRM96410.1 GDP-mannose-dependent alpha-mannosyltransferase [Pseudomonas sp. 22 E 5]MCX9153812.1 glycosyltransferase family 1 protein [Pseudomonas sp. TB1-B1]QXH66607.1 glycosyltransferase family 1 protein [Pseudomonas asgharzadehiana]TFW40785.1 glycosyltransferase family 1 protein [Pseudomonas fluorescens]TKJ56624.1 glycosyltransferase family 1 protein [Pseudomonas sp. CFBP13506]